MRVACDGDIGNHQDMKSVLEQILAKGLHSVHTISFKLCR